MTSRIVQAWDFARRNLAGFGVELTVNAVLPLVIYLLLDKELGDVGALLASSAPPILWSLAEFVRRRRVDALSMLVLAGIALSLLAFFGGGGARFLQLRENLVTGVIGVVFLGSIALRRPLMYYLAQATMRRSSAEEAASFETMKDSDLFRQTMRTMTLVWGVGLLARTAAACWLVFSVSIPTYLALSPVVGNTFMGALALWTFLFVRRRRRIGAALRATREAAEIQNATPVAKVVAS